MTRQEIASKNSKAREQKSKQLIISAITGLYQDDFRKGKNKDKWNVGKIADFTHLTRQTVSKHLRVWEANQGSLFEAELGTVELPKDQL